MLSIEDASTLDANGQAEVLARAELDRRRPFAIAAAPPLRTHLVRVSPNAYVLFVAMHHIMVDGGSFDILWRELWASYDALVAGQSAPALPPLTVQYADYAAWQRSWLAGTELERQLAFWKEQLRGVPEEVPLPFKGPRPPRQTFTGGEHLVKLDARSTVALRALARREGATLFMTLAAAFRAVLVRYTGESDFLLGTAIDNRTVDVLEGLVGMFANTLALRTEVRPDDTFLTLLAREKANALAAYAHQHTPFELIVDALGVERSLSRPPLVQVMYVHQGEVATRGRGTPVETAGAPAAEFDLTLMSRPVRSHADRAARTAPGAASIATPEQRLSDVVLLDADERRRVLVEWNATERSVSDEQVAAVVDRHARVVPDAIALEHRGTRLTYSELDRRANQLAHRYRACGVTTGGRVAVFLERSPEVVIAWLAAWKAGAAYLPIAPDLGAPRIAAMLADAHA